MAPAFKALHKILTAFGLDVDKIRPGSMTDALRAVEQYGNEEVERYRHLAAYLHDEDPELWPDTEVTPAVLSEDR